MNDQKANIQMVSRLLFKLLPIQILLSAVGAVNGIVSSLFASNFVGEKAMGAVGLYSPLSIFIGAVSLMLVSGALILSGRYMGENQVERTENVFSLSIIITILFTAVLTAVLLIGGLFDLTGFVTSDTELRAYFNTYLLGQAIGLLPMLLGSQLAAFMSLENQRRRTTAASLILIVANVIFNYLFVGAMKLGVFGLALAASLGYWVFFILQIPYYLTGKSLLRIRLRGIRLRDAGEIVRIGLPGSLTNGYQMIRGIIVNALLLAYVGSVGLSAMTAANMFLGFIWAIPAGMLAVSRMLISISIGEEDRQTLTDVMRVMVRRFIPLMCAIAAVIFICAVPLTHLYYHDPAEPVFQMTAWGFRLLPLCMPLAVFDMHFTCYGQASGKTALVHGVCALDGFIGVSGCAALIVPLIGQNGVYIANIFNGFAVMAVFILYAVIKNKRMPRTMDELMVIPDTFGVSESERMDLTLANVDEVVAVAERVQSFCAARGVDARRSYLAGLCLEEMAGNVIEHGFTKDKKPHSVDVRVVHKDDSLILRIKDDCIAFDPAERQKMIDPDDPAKNIGIRMVYAIANSVAYQNILGLNVLTIQL